MNVLFTSLRFTGSFLVITCHECMKTSYLLRAISENLNVISRPSFSYASVVTFWPHQYRSWLSFVVKTAATAAFCQHDS